MSLKFKAAVVSAALLIAGAAHSQTAVQPTPQGVAHRNPIEEQPAMSDDVKSANGTVEMKAAAALTTKILAIGVWTAKAPPEARPAIMPHEARDTLRLMLRGKIDQWFAKTDGSGAVFLLNVTSPAEARELLEDLPLGRAGMMTFEYIPVGPLWPLGLMLVEPT